MTTGTIPGAHFRAAHDALATLLAYPAPQRAMPLLDAAAAVARVVPDARADLEPFVTWADGLRTSELEELYTQTFDHSATRALEVGWHVFGETYDRGAFLVRMRERLRAHGIDENGELPDHLSHVLAVLGRADAAEARELGAHAILAIARVAAALAEDKSPWTGVLDAAWKLVASYAEATIHVSATPPGYENHEPALKETRG